MPLFGSLTNFARWLTRSREEAEDLVQETYARALRGFSGYTPGTSIRAWMFRILKNAFLSSRTSAHARATVPLGEEDPPDEAEGCEATPETLLLARDRRERVRAAIEALHPAHREVVLLRDVEGFSYQEIADALSIPVGTVMSRLARARQVIRRAVQGGC